MGFGFSSASHVCDPTTPSVCRPCERWNASTAARVTSPYQPSARPIEKPSSTSRCCNCSTSGPVSCGRSTRRPLESSCTVVGGGSVAGVVSTGTVVSAGTSGTVVSGVVCTGEVPYSSCCTPTTRSVRWVPEAASSDSP